MKRTVSRKVMAIAGCIGFLSLHLWIMPLRTEAADDKPALAVFLEKSDIRQNDAVRVHFQVNNNGSVPIASATIVILSPSAKFKWHCGGCRADEKPISSLELSRISPSQSIDTEAWFRTEGDVDVGQFNLLFRLETVSDSKPPQRSVSLVEKAINVKLLGTDTLAGVPLALSGLVIPGLCFWLILSWFGVSWSTGLALGDKLIYSVMVSFFLVMLDSWWFSADIFSGLSMQKLAIWGASGIVPGILIGGFDKGRRMLKARNEKAITIGPLDDEQTIFRKLLVRYAEKISNKPYSKVVTRSNEASYGSLVYQDTERTLLLGWYKVKRSDLRKNNEWKYFADEQDMNKFYKGLLEKKVVLEQVEGIQQLAADGNFAPAGTFLQAWNNNQVRYAELEDTGWRANPLTIE